MNKHFLILPDGTRSEEVLPQVNELSSILRRLDKETDVRATLLIRSRDAEALRDKLTEHGIPERTAVEIYDDLKHSGFFLKLASKTEKAVTSLSGKNENLRDFLLNLLPINLIMSFGQIQALRQDKAQAQALLDRLKPDIFIHQRDRNIGLSFAINRLMTAAGKPVLLSPWGYVNTAYSVQNRKDSRRNHLDGWHVSLLQRLLARLTPEQVFRSGNRSYTFLKSERWLAALVTGLLPSKPWFFGDDATRCAVSSNASAKALIAGGIDPSKLIVTGDPTHDSFFLEPSQRTRSVAEIRDSLLAKREDRLIVVALPHLAEHNILPWDKHWVEIEYIVSTLVALPHTKVLVSLHPRCQRSKYLYLESKFGIKVADRPLKEFISLADFFVGTWSGTTEWPAIAGIKTVIMSWFGVSGYGLEHVFPFISIVEKREDFREKLERKLEEKEDPSVQKLRGDLPRFDGQATERIVQLALDLVSDDPLRQKKTSRFRRLIAHLAPSFG